MIAMQAFSRGLMGLAMVGAIMLAATASAAPRHYVVDEEHVSVAFRAGHARFADVIGLFTEVRGAFVYDPATQALVSGHAEVAADSVFTGHEGRDEHVRDGDFLAAGEHPIIRFDATGYQPVGETGGTLDGELTIRGVTRPVSLEVEINRLDAHPIGGAETLGASMRGSLQRSDFGMDYALEGDLVSDRIELLIEFEAIRADDE